MPEQPETVAMEGFVEALAALLTAHPTHSEPDEQSVAMVVECPYGSAHVFSLEVGHVNRLTQIITQAHQDADQAAQRHR